MPGVENQFTPIPMKTSSKVFAALFLILGMWSATEALSGATHQYWLAYISLIVSAFLAYETKTTPNEQE